MNTKQMQFNRHKVAALLLAGVILAAGLAWTGADVQPTQAGQPWSQPEFIAGSKIGAGTEGVSFQGGESGLSSESQLRFIAGRKPGVGAGFGNGTL